MITPNHQHRRGSALIITLSATVLITVVILAFYSRVMMERQISFSSTNQIKAEALAHSALDIVVGEMREEIRSGSTALNGGNANYPTVYQPTSTATALPQKKGVSNADSTVGLYTIVKATSTSTPINPSTGGRAIGSVTPTTTASLNGRKWTSARWFTSGPKLGSADAPTWALVSRNKGIVVKTSVGDVTDVKDPTNDNYVIGRFSYVVYDLSSLADANVAGYPTLASTQAATRASAAYADLEPFSAGLGNNLALWRNAATGADVVTFDEWASGLERATNSNASAIAAARSGHRSIAVGDNLFFSRRDLLKNAQTSGAASSLTHFSRTLNAPSWSPLIDATGTFSYKTAANTATSINRNLPNVRFAQSGTVTHYRDDGTTETYTVTEGDPLLQRRFSLARIKWLRLKEENPSSTTYDAAIQSCFGLVWKPAQARWEYVGSTGSTTISSIDTLDAVATAAMKREPNFFELLKAGILEGSLGVPAQQKTLAKGDPATLSSITTGGQYYLENSRDLQLLRIGANIIDCADGDNYPTIISFSTDLEVAGVEDLPYFYGMTMVGLRQSTTTTVSGVVTTQLTAADLVWIPSFFNPHATSSPDAGPVTLTASSPSGVLTEVKLSDGVSLKQSGLSRLFSSLPAISIAASGFHDAPAPSRATQNGDASRLDKQVLRTNGTTYVDSTAADVQGWNLFSYQHDYMATQSGYIATMTWPTGSIHRVLVQNVIVRLQYGSRSGIPKTYATLTGHEAFPAETGWNGTPSASEGSYTGFGPSFASAARLNNTTLDNFTYFAVPADPRTTRWGLASGDSRGAFATPSVSDRNDGVRTAVPFSTLSAVVTASTRMFYTLWPQGGESTNKIPDRDSLLRRVDGSQGDNANLYRLLTDTTRRPIILQRPYRSVGELGYVFRDTPWRTLNFSDPNSADGALLDLFSVCDEPSVTAGRFSLNTPQTIVQKSLLQNAAQISTTLAASLATAYKGFAFTGAANTPTSTLPYTPAQLANFIGTDPSALSAVVNKPPREAAVRALASTTQTRTWNLLIDVVAQVGHYPANTTSLNNFNVEGEKRYWLSVAIDRYTGQVIDQQLEPVYE